MEVVPGYLQNYASLFLWVPVYRDALKYPVELYQYYIGDTATAVILQ